MLEHNNHIMAPVPLNHFVTAERELKRKESAEQSEDPERQTAS
jgi:hypothetical protein